MVDTLLIDCEQPESGVTEMIRDPVLGPRIATVGMYELDGVRLQDYRSVLVGMHVDQRYLAARRDRLDGFVAAGGTIHASGHVAHPYLAGLSRFEPLEGYRVEDLAVTNEASHPVWQGVEMADLSFRKGVAGFYARGGHAPPGGARLIQTIGPRRLPVDFEYRLGAGRVLFHGGNDLWTYLGTGTSADRMVPQLFDWLSHP